MKTHYIAIGALGGLITFLVVQVYVLVGNNQVLYPLILMFAASKFYPFGSVVRTSTTGQLNEGILVWLLMIVGAVIGLAISQIVAIVLKVREKKSGTSRQPGSTDH